jgi:hypothetical protein
MRQGQVLSEAYTADLAPCPRISALLLLQLQIEHLGPGLLLLLLLLLGWCCCLPCLLRAYAYSVQQGTCSVANSSRHNRGTFHCYLIRLCISADRIERLLQAEQQREQRTV